MNGTELLVKAGCAPHIVAHCRKVSETALSFADRISVKCDRELVRLGGLYHDIGRSRSHDYYHAIAGVEIGRKLGLSDALLSIIERHIGAGITAREAGQLGLPRKDYLPLTVEEKLVSYADNLVNGTRQMLFPEALERFITLLGPDNEGVERFRKQHAEMQRWIK